MDNFRRRMHAQQPRLTDYGAVRRGIMEHHGAAAVVIGAVLRIAYFHLSPPPCYSCRRQVL